jgi:hypothetical protein
VRAFLEVEKTLCEAPPVWALLGMTVPYNELPFPPCISFTRTPNPPKTKLQKIHTSLYTYLQHNTTTAKKF